MKENIFASTLLVIVALAQLLIYFLLREFLLVFDINLSVSNWLLYHLLTISAVSILFVRRYLRKNRSRQNTLRPSQKEEVLSQKEQVF